MPPANEPRDACSRSSGFEMMARTERWTDTAFADHRERGIQLWERDGASGTSVRRQGLGAPLDGPGIRLGARLRS